MFSTLELISRSSLRSKRQKLWCILMSKALLDNLPSHLFILWINCGYCGFNVWIFLIDPGLFSRSGETVFYYFVPSSKDNLQSLKNFKVSVSPGNIFKLFFKDFFKLKRVTGILWLYIKSLLFLILLAFYVFQWF